MAVSERRSNSLKKFYWITAIILLLNSALSGAAYADRLLVIPFDAQTEKLKKEKEKILDVMSKLINKSQDLESVSEQQFWDNWASKVHEVGGNTEKFLTPLVLSLAENLKEFSKNSENSRGLFSDESSLGTLVEHKELWGIDFVYLMDLYPSSQNNIYRVHSRLISITTGRFRELSSESKLNEIVNTLKKQYQTLINNHAELSKRYADEVVDPIYSIVRYNLVSTDGNIIGMDVDYAGNRPIPDLQDVKFNPPQGQKADGERMYLLKAEDNRNIELVYEFHDQALKNVRIDMPSRYPEGPDIETLLVKSAGGHSIRFIFTWKDNELLSVKVEPEDNPYP